LTLGLTGFVTDHETVELQTPDPSAIEQFGELIVPLVCGATTEKYKLK
jgi:hypothetical protein